MGFFSSKPKSRSKHHKLQPASLTAPPNIYTSPELPSRPAPAAPRSDFYHHQAVSQPQFNHTPPANIPPPPVPYPYPYSTSPPAIPPNPHYQSSPARNQNGLPVRFSESMVDLAGLINVPTNTAALRKQLASSTNVANAAYDDIRNRFDSVMTLIDCESLSGHENTLFLCQEPTSQNSLVSSKQQAVVHQHSEPLPNQETERALNLRKKRSGEQKKALQTAHVAVSVVSGNYFSKVELYANSKLAMNLPPLRLYMPTWPLLCLAAQYSHHVYTTPQKHELNTHIPSSLRNNTKAMRIKSVSMDHAHTIVFAIRGTASFSDWAVNLNMAPAQPTNFLDDDGNYCHAGFLSVARKMVKPVAARLRQLLEEDPGRAGYSLLMTGHSAGGAVAALLYSHMLSGVESELTLLAGCFKRIHCVTFGAPPISLLPLETPRRREFRKSVFLSFINEGDPVARASKPYVRSLIELLTNPPPKTAHKKRSRPEWKVPPSTLSNAGRIVVLRTGDPHAPVTDYKTVRERLGEGVVAVTCREDQLRGVIWGDPVAHMMSLYAGRIEVLAVGAVTVKRR